MALLQRTALLLCLLGVANAASPRPSNEEWKKAKAGDDAKAAQADADQGKMAAVDKVVRLLEDLTKKVQAEGEEEAASYNKFSCFCKTVQAEKVQAIQEAKDNKASLTASINKLASGRKADDKKIADLDKEIKETNDDMSKAKQDNAADMKRYGAEKADLSSAIEGITNALKTLKASKPSLLQMKSVSDTVREAIAMADALGLSTDSSALLQDAPGVEMENYKFHSSGVIGTLEKLLATFRGKKSKSDETEVQRLQDHDMEMQSNTDKVKAKTLELEDTTRAKNNKIAEIASNSQELTVESSNLLSDQQYLKELYSTCQNKANTWDTRSQVRADELSALTAATTIIKGAVREKTSSATLRFAQRGVTIRIAEAMARDDNSMEAVEEAAEEKEGLAPAAFLQRRSVSRHSPEGSSEAVDRISELLRKVGGKTKSTLLTGLASQISSAKPKGMEKIKTLIEELINRLQSEAANEATQKGWCDKSLADANTKKLSTSQTVTELNDSLSKLEATRTLLSEQLDQLAAEIKELKDAQEDADKMRKKEKDENAATVKEAGEGKKAVESAVAVLEKFYKGNADNKDKAAKAAEHVKDAPDGGFADGEAYAGDQSSATGILGMLEVITSDFVRTIKETEKAEQEGDQDHKAFTQTTQTAKKEKEDIEKARKKEKDDADADFDKQKESMKKKTDLLVTTIEELMELKTACVDTGMSYADRVARREDEIAALRKGLCILEGSANYGPNAAEYDQCS